mmetsp:Transcript_7701/g.15095  ORF Transcript_7701/g.15095 Transcript_7701/m.15095 type:complete len:85 (+) Transcript_7701:401-655(+)
MCLARLRNCFVQKLLRLHAWTRSGARKLQRHGTNAISCKMSVAMRRLAYVAELAFPSDMGSEEGTTCARSNSTSQAPLGKALPP